MPLITGTSFNITNRTAGTPYNVEVRAVDTSGNEGPGASATLNTLTAGDGSLFSDTFSGANMATPDPAKWNVVNPDAAYVKFRLNTNMLELAVLQNALSTNPYANRIETVPTFTDGILEFFWNFQTANQHNFYYGWGVDIDNYAVLSRVQADPTKARILTRVAGVNSVTETAIGAAPRWWRIRAEGNVFTFSHSADGVSWTQEGTPKTAAIGSTRRAFFGHGLTGYVATNSIDSVKIWPL